MLVLTPSKKGGIPPMNIMTQVLVEFTLAIALLTAGAIAVFTTALYIVRRIKAMPKLRLAFSVKRNSLATE
jgi:hypothetical protein